jgi:hypothetical protein
MAEQMAAAFDYIRCDFYDLDGAIYFGELTVYPTAGFPWIADRHIRDCWNVLWDIRKSWFLAARQTGLRSLYAGALRSRIDAELIDRRDDGRGDRGGQTASSGPASSQEGKEASAENVGIF